MNKIGKFIKEECDSGTDCDEYGQCNEGTIPDETNPGHCYQEVIKTYIYIIVLCKRKKCNKKGKNFPFIFLV